MLRQIVAEKTKKLAERKRKHPLCQLQEKLPAAPPLRPFAKALAEPGISLIAEVKKASPSHGDFQLTKTAAEMARLYEAGGARALSVLTEEAFFKGKDADLATARQAASLPVLRKDFIIDEYQLYESRLLPADAVLLIAGLLPEVMLRRCLEICAELGLAALVEAHSPIELALALRAGAKIVGINNRNLATFRTDVRHTLRLARLVPESVLLVSESGIQSASDLRVLAQVGVDAVLVGESLVKAKDPVQKIRELLGGAQDDN